ncbi:hypothetical protein [Rhizobium mongolense]|uniref:Tetratricopeptide repeat protein n=2 Tax=Rhizobium mongolense TaxID=57676 RepID=A0ABR6IN61_9HYPH|nr:hypothetical protein [Rhizobium mongolense]MBB4229331.1 hypothetical protein [Rhizobium mongolense]TVZ63123.1 hypothetical protein BCL32_3244 [Rhizobium mongolense USDA 1844]
MERQYSASSKGLLFLKEWGGIGTLVIALLYTFPKDVWKEITGREERARVAEENAILAVRRTLADMAALRAEKASRISQSTDPRYQNEIVGAYDIRIYNLIYTQKDEFKERWHKLRSSELYMLGSSLALIGEVGEAQFYYDKAIEAAISEKRPDNITTIYREKGNSLFMDTPYQDKENARVAYVKALTSLSGDKRSSSPYLYVTHLSELVGFEILYGDWQCGMSKRAYVNSLYEALGKNNPALSSYYQMFSGINSRFRPGKGCTWKIPAHFALSSLVTPPN